MEHMMLWTCLKPHLRPEKAILASLWKLNFSPWWHPGFGHRFVLDWASGLLRKSGICSHCCCRWSWLKTWSYSPSFYTNHLFSSFTQSLRLKSLARSTPDRRPRVHSQLLHFLINFSVSLTSVSKLATASLSPGALQSFGFPNESLMLAHCSTTPAPAWPKPQSLACKAVSGLLLPLAGKTHQKRTINTLLMCQGTDWSACWPKATERLLFTLMCLRCCAAALIAQLSPSLRAQWQMRGPPLISRPLH